MLYPSFTVSLDKKVCDTNYHDQLLMKSDQYGIRGVAFQSFSSHLFNRFHIVKNGDAFFCCAAIVPEGGEKGQNLVLCCSFFIFLICPSKVNKSYLIFLHMLITYCTILILLCAFTFTSCKTSVSLDEKLLPESEKFKN